MRLRHSVTMRFYGIIQKKKEYLIKYEYDQCIKEFFFIFLSLSVFGLLSSSLLLFPQSFGRYVIRPSSGVGRTQEPSRNFELRPLLNSRGSCSDSVSHNRILVLSIPVLLFACSQD